MAGSRKFLRLIKEGSYEEALSIARKQVDDGAMVLDVNMDDGLLDAEKEMKHFLNMLACDPDIYRVPAVGQVPGTAGSRIKSPCPPEA